MINEIKKGVYDITVNKEEGRRYRVYFFDVDTPILIDTGHTETVDTLIELIDDHGLEPERLLITHGDSDHIGGIDALTDRYEVDVFAPDKAEIDSEYIPDKRFSNGECIGPFITVSVPGHASHHYAFIDQDRKLAVLGDALFGSDFRGLPPGYFTLPPGIYSENLNEADKELESLLPYDFEMALLFHGSSVKDEAKKKLEKFVNFPGKP